MKRAMAAAVMIVALASNATAQIIRPTMVNRPSMYASLSAGYLTQQLICDPVNKACWTFGDGPQYRASFEMPISVATSVGISYSHSRLPLRWADTPPNAANCTGCDANAEMHQFLGLIHLGGSGPFTQLIDISAGATRFANFKTTSGTPLGNGKAVTDFSFAVAFGFGVRLTQSVHFTFQQEYGVLFHKRVSGSANSSAQQRTLRAGLRMGL